MPTKFEVPPTCPNPTTCTWAGDCVARQLLEHELSTRVNSKRETNLPPQHDAVESLMRAAKCTNPGFIVTLWKALEFLIHNPRE